MYTKETKKLWRLYEWSRSLNGAAAHHAHCSLQCTLNECDTGRVKNQGPSNASAGMVVFGVHVVAGFFNQRLRVGCSKLPSIMK